MTQQELCKAKDQDLIASVAAMKRAAALARQVAVQTGTRIVVNVNDTIVWRTALQLQAELTDTQRGTD
jgi:hypothetical protein